MNGIDWAKFQWKSEMTRSNTQTSDAEQMSSHSPVNIYYRQVPAWSLCLSFVTHLRVAKQISFEDYEKAIESAAKESDFSLIDIEAIAESMQQLTDRTVVSRGDALLVFHSYHKLKF